MCRAVVLEWDNVTTIQRATAGFVHQSVNPFPKNLIGTRHDQTLPEGIAASAR